MCIVYKGLYWYIFVIHWLFFHVQANSIFYYLFVELVFFFVVNFTGNCCQSCVTRIPYATLIATVMCLIGVGIFCGTMYRGTSLTIIMFDTVFRLRLAWIDAIQIIFVIVGASMAALGFMILFVGCLATGATRHKVYRAWGSRVGGRISCAVVSTTAKLKCCPHSFKINKNVFYSSWESLTY